MHFQIISQQDIIKLCTGLPFWIYVIMIGQSWGSLFCCYLSSKLFAIRVATNLCLAGVPRAALLNKPTHNKSESSLIQMASNELQHRDSVLRRNTPLMIIIPRCWIPIPHTMADTVQPRILEQDDLNNWTSAESTQTKNSVHVHVRYIKCTP